jgi:hypothetical protein
MRREVGLVAALLAVALVGCSSGDSISIEVFSYEGEGFGTVPFRASGVAVDEAVVCENGTMEQDHLESPEGEIITSEEGGELYEAAKADRGVMDTYAVQEFVCDDGSGTFTMKTHTRSDFAKTESQQDTPTWEIENGTGDYATLSGSGDASMIFGGSPDEATAAFTGEVQTG